MVDIHDPGEKEKFERWMAEWGGGLDPSGVRSGMHMTSGKRRVRRSKEEARKLILEAAEALLREGGPGAVSVRAVAAKVGITDAAVNHHFGTREELLEALLRHGGRRLKTELNVALGRWRETDCSVRALVDVIADLYAGGGYSELALRLHLSGWRDRGAGLLDPVVEELHDLRSKALSAQGKKPPSISETQFVVGLMHQVLALDPLFGEAFRRSAGMLRAMEPPADRKRTLWGVLLRAMLEAEFEAAPPKSDRGRDDDGR